MVVAGGADDPVFRIHKGVGALDDVTAAVMLLGGEIAQGRRLLGINIPDGNAAQKRHHAVVVIVKEDRRRGIGVGGLVGHVDLRINAQGHDLIRRVRIIAVAVDVGVNGGHIRVHVHRLGGQGLDRQGTGPMGCYALFHLLYSLRGGLGGCLGGCLGRCRGSLRGLGRGTGRSRQAQGRGQGQGTGSTGKSSAIHNRSSFNWNLDFLREGQKPPLGMHYRVPPEPFQGLWHELPKNSTNGILSIAFSPTGCYNGI